MDSDSHLVKASLDGDRQAFADIVDRYKSLVCTVAYSSTGDFGVSEDLAQETFLRAWTNLGSVKNAGSLRTWLCGIARNLALSWRRQRHRDVLTGAKPIDSSLSYAGVSPAPSQRAIENEQQALVWQTLEGLPEIYRIPLILFYREGKSVSRVAELLELSTDAVKQRLHRGRQMLKQEVMTLVEDSLERTRPRDNFTPKLLAALPIVSARGLAKISTATPFATAKIIGAGAAVVLIGVVGFLRFNGTPEAVSPREPSQNAYAFSENAVLPESAATEPSALDANARLANHVEPDASLVANILAPLETAPPGYPGVEYPDSLSQTIVGRVFDPRGVPVGGATVWLARFAMDVRDTRETVTDDTGSFTLTAPPGQWMLRARKGIQSGEADIAFAGQIITVENGATIETAIHMLERGRVHGRILERTSAAPIPFGTLWTSDRFLVRADADGRYEIEGQRPGYNTLIALCTNYERKYVIYSPLQARETELDIFLDRGGTVRGQIVDPQGRPLAHAWVYRPMSGYGSTSASSEVCDDNGRFEFDGLPFGQPFRLAARMPSFQNVCDVVAPGEVGETRSDEFVLTPSQATRTITMTLDPIGHPEVRTIQTWSDSKVGGIVTGRVLDPAGRPVRNFRVLTQSPLSDGVRAATEVNDFRTGFSFTTDDGFFAVTRPGWQPGQALRIVAVADGFGQAAIDRVLVRPYSNVSSRQQDVVLRVNPAARLSVRVVRQETSDTPLAGARVTLRDAHLGDAGAFDWQDAHSSLFRPISAYTDDQGWARFENLTLSEGMILIEKEGYARERIDWNRREERKNTVVRGEAVVEGHVRDAEGKPLSVGSMSLRWGDAVSPYNSANRAHNRIDVRFADTDPGHFRVDQLPPGKYALKIAWPDGNHGEHVYSDEFMLKAGDARQVKYPDDTIFQNPDRWLAGAGESSADQTLRKAIVGTWMRNGFSARGAAVRIVLRFTEVGEFERRIVTGDTTLHEKGWFRVEVGTLRIACDDGEGLTYTVVQLPDADTLSLGRTGLAPEDPFHRTNH